MNKTSYWMLILLLPVLAALAGLTALPAACLAAEELTVTMTLDKEGVIQAGDSLTATLHPSGGRAPYFYNFTMIIYENEEPHIFRMDSLIAESSHTWPVDFGDRLVLKGLIMDSNSAMATCEASLEIQGGVYDPLTITDESFGPGNTVNLGDAITYSISAQGGQPPYTYDYKLRLVQDDCYFEPKGGDGHSANSFSYTITRGTEGAFYCIVEDALGRKAYSQQSFEFTILGDNHAPMNFSETHDMVKLGKDSYRVTIQASATGGAQPVRFYCWWILYKNGDLIDEVLDLRGDGAFSLEGDFDRATASLNAADADNWWSVNHFNLTFDTKDADRPYLSDLIVKDPLREARDTMRIESLNPDRLESLKKFLEAVQGDSSDDPDGSDMITVTPVADDSEWVRPDLATPDLSNNPRMNRPLATATPEPEETTGPEILPTDLLNPDMIMPQVPNLQPPQAPGFPNP